MDTITQDSLKTLAEQSEGPYVSIYMQTHRAGQETQKDPIRLKNLLKEAEKRLSKIGLRTPDINKFLEPARNLVEDFDFWQHQDESLAIFTASDFFQTFRLPVRFEEFLVVADRFHIKPLLRILNEDGQYYLLALSQNEVKLYKGARHNITELEPEDIPKSLADALKYDEFQKQQQFHTATPGQPTTRPAIYHGQGVGIDEKKDNIQRFFRQIDKGLQSVLQDDPLPLVLAGVEFLFPIYQEVTSYTNLVEQGIEGNPENMGSDELRQQAWNVVAPIYRQAQDDAVAKFNALTNTNQASQDINELVPAAVYGRIDTLLVAVRDQVWGMFDPDANEIHLEQEQTVDNEDLLNFATLHTLLNGGTVFALEQESMPGNSSVAAILRY